jgi:hypothetical protein
VIKNFLNLLFGHNGGVAHHLPTTNVPAG